MNAVEILSELAPKPSLSLYQIELLSVSVTLVIFFCMLIIAYGIASRGTSQGIPLRNFLSGLIMSSISLAFAEPGSEAGPASLMNKFGATVHCIVCLVTLIYSPDFNRDARLTAGALVLFSIMINLKEQALLVTLVWSYVHLVILPGVDFLNSRKSGVSTPPDVLTVTLYLSAALSSFGWGSYIYLAGLPTLAMPYFIGMTLMLLNLKDAYSSKVKTA